MSGPNVFPSSTLNLNPLQPADTPSLLDIRPYLAMLSGPSGDILREMLGKIQFAFDNLQETLRAASPSLSYLQIDAADIAVLAVGGEFGPGEFTVYNGPPDYAPIGWIGSRDSELPVAITSIVAGLVTTAAPHGLKVGDNTLIEATTDALNTGYYVCATAPSTTTFTVTGGVAGGDSTGGTSTELYQGGWLKTLAVGGTSPADAHFLADVDGSLSITDALITLVGTFSTIVLDPTTGTITVTQAGGGQRTRIQEGIIFLDDTLGAEDQSYLYPGFMQLTKTGINTNAKSAVIELKGYTTASPYGPRLDFRQFGGSPSADTETLTGDSMGGFVAWGFDGIGESQYAAGVRAVATEDHDATSHGTKLVFETTPNASASPATAVTIDGLGVEIADTLGIGTPPVSQRGIDFGGTITAVANEARGIRVGNSLTLAASADSDLLAGILVNPVFDAGAFAGVTKYGIYASTTEPNYFAGDLILGAKATTYNNAATAGIGAVPVYASVALTNQSASIGATNLQVGGAVAPVGQYRVSWHTATRTAGAGSVLVTVGWNDGISAKTLTGTINLTAGAFQTIITPIIHADGTNNITYATTYAATGAYDIYVTLERLA
jgi:hypothetical protein